MDERAYIQGNQPEGGTKDEEKNLDIGGFVDAGSVDCSMYRRGYGGEAGSGSGSQQPADTPAETGQDENGASDPTEVPKLTVWHIEVGEQKNALEQAIKRFEEEHQVEVEFVQHENDPLQNEPGRCDGYR